MSIYRLGMGSTLLVLALLVAGCSSEEAELESPVRLQGNIFGSFYQVSISDRLTASRAEALEAGFLEVLNEIDATMSTYREDAELVDFNHSPIGEWQTLSDELIEVLAISETILQLSGGAFDPTIGGLANLWSFGPEARPREIPDEQELQSRLDEIGFAQLEVDTNSLQARRLSEVFVDLSGVAKGYATDRVATYLDGEGVEHYLVNLGGDLIAKGYRDRDSTPWRIGVEVPEDGSQQIAQHTLPVHDMSVATSGDYRNYFEEDGRRFSHTIDPRSGYPVDHTLASVSVLHPSNAWADAWATALLVLGPDEGLALAREQELMVLTLERDSEGWTSRTSPAFVDYFGREQLEALGIEIDD
ncbi:MULTISPECIES: FAD:protein FMN transferase [Halomonadaceae]|uniref:FAD:protein FMN transferase n=1 Tax=Halomonadaceae TaxID=28256 RepID=UPI001598F742|nr:MULTISPECIES: FAD:protein FMN transferase [Halomonas]QJQ95619.1 FAD:protein FMN transferase [Halomonas sp. PA5]